MFMALFLDLILSIQSLGDLQSPFHESFWFLEGLTRCLPNPLEKACRDLAMGVLAACSGLILI